MTYEEFLRLQNQQPGFAFGSLGANQPTPPAAPPITEVAPPQGAMPGQGQPMDWRELAKAEAQRMLAQGDQADKQMSPMVPLGMALMSMGQQMQIPPHQRGQNNNLQAMANSLLAWQMNQQKQGDRKDLRRSQAIELLGKANQPTWQEQALMTYKMARGAKQEDLETDIAKAEATQQLQQKYAAPQKIDVQEGENVATYLRYPDGRMEKLGAGPKWDQNKQGMEVSLPDGTTVRMGGSQGVASPSGLQKPTMNDVEKYLLNSGDQMRMLKEIKSLYKPEYQTYEGQVKGWLSNQQEKIGIPLSDDQQRFLGDYTGYRRSAYEMQSKILNQLSGAAVTEHEAKRIKGFTIDPEKDSPTALKSKLEGFEQSLKRTVARTNYIRKHGISIKNAPDDIDKVMIQRGQELQRQGMQPEQVRQQLADEFGLVN